MTIKPKPGEWATYETGFPPWVEEFVEWLCTPRPDREPTHQHELAKKWGLNPATLSHVKEDPRFDKLLEKRYAELNIRADRLQEVVDAMHKKATAGDTTAAKLYIEYVRMLKPIKQVVEQDKSITEMTEEELDAEWERLRGERH